VRHDTATKVAARKAAEAAAVREVELASQGSLRALLDAYISHLETQGKASASEARPYFKHVPAELAERRASQLGAGDFVPAIGALVQAGRGPSARKLRAYLRTANQQALASQSNPAAPQSMRAFGIEYNPVASVGALSQFARTRDRVLSDDELAGYLRGLEGLKGRGAYLRVALIVGLYLGGQRQRQLMRAVWTEVDLAGASITLRDGKGGRRQPRVYELPLTSVPLAILKRRSELAPYDPRVFATAHAGTLSNRVTAISRALVRRGEVRSPFKLSDVRRTCETAMSRLGISSDVLARAYNTSTTTATTTCARTAPPSSAGHGIYGPCGALPAAPRATDPPARAPRSGHSSYLEHTPYRSRVYESPCGDHY
jgi:integrase